MYLRPAFVETNLERIQALIEAHPFGVLVTRATGALDGSHVPFSVAREGDALVLSAHLAAANPQCAALAGGEALAIFGGPHAYIAPGWYHAQPAVPTWDYAAVHVHGHLEPVKAPDGMTEMLHALAAEDPHRFDVDALPERFRATMMADIRAFRLRSERIEAQWKMSQNRSVADRQQLVAALRTQQNHAVADLIEGTLPAES